MDTMKKLLFGFALAFIGNSLLALPAYEPFADATGSGGTAYTAGANLVGQTNAQGQAWFQAGAAIPSSSILSGSLSVSGLAPSSGNSVLAVPQANVASRFAFGSSINSGSVYYSFAFQVPAIGSTLGTGGGFIAGFNNTGAASQTGSPTVIGARVLIRAATGGFNIGLSKSSGTASDFQWSSQLFTPSDTIFIVGSYDIGVLATAGDDSTRMWVNPSSANFGAASAPAATLTAATGGDALTSGSLQSFLLYERANTLFPDQAVLDELRIGTSWADVTPTTVPEPASAALAGLASLAGVFWFRARRQS
jgi:hypothetical protein